MIARSGLLLLLVMIAGLGMPRTAAASAIPSIEIQIPGRPEPVRLAPADAEAFQRRLDSPPPYVGPAPGGEPVLVRTEYWDAALGSGVNAAPVKPEAAYFTVDGIVRIVRGDNEQAFVVLDHRQRAMLARYVRLARTGSIPNAPGALQVLAAASGTEPVTIGIGGAPLEDRPAQAIWVAINGHHGASFIDPPRPPAAATGYWLTFTSAEGRVIQYHFDPDSKVLTDALGSETYLIPAGLPVAPDGAPAIEQQEPPGSLLWWPLMLGGGAASLAVAVWVRRRSGS